MKKGQIMGQPLVYVFIAIVAILVLFFGIRMVMQLVGLEEEVSGKAFYGDIKGKFDSVYTDSMGSVVFLDDVRVPNELKEICFMDRNYGAIDLSSISDPDLKNILEIYSDSDFDENVFIYFGGPVGSEEYTIEKLDVPEGLVCDSLLDSKINVKFVNQGQRVEAQHI
jgi:hypothetical protein